MERGLYKHFKGNFYYVFGVAKFNDVILVVYAAALHSDDAYLFLRPLDMFLDEVADGKNRFERIDCIDVLLLNDNSCGKNEDEVFGDALHTETNEEFVVYKKLSKDEKYFRVVRKNS